LGLSFGGELRGHDLSGGVLAHPADDAVFIHNGNGFGATSTDLDHVERDALLSRRRRDSDGIAFEIFAIGDQDLVASLEAIELKLKRT
jgi:hypothetical protein